MNIQTKSVVLDIATPNVSLGDEFKGCYLTQIVKESDHPANINNEDYVLNPITGNLKVNVVYSDGDRLFVQACKF